MFRTSLCAFAVAFACAFAVLAESASSTRLLTLSPSTSGLLITSINASTPATCLPFASNFTPAATFFKLVLPRPVVINLKTFGSLNVSVKPATALDGFLTNCFVNFFPRNTSLMTVDTLVFLKAVFPDLVRTLPIPTLAALGGITFKPNFSAILFHTFLPTISDNAPKSIDPPRPVSRPVNLLVVDKSLFLSNSVSDLATSDLSFKDCWKSN